MRSVRTFHVVCRLSFGKAKLLRLGKGSLKTAFHFRHARQDEIRGAVDYANDARHPVPSKALAQRLDDRNAASNRGFEAKRNAASSDF